MEHFTSMCLQRMATVTVKRMMYGWMLEMTSTRIHSAVTVWPDRDIELC